MSAGAPLLINGRFAAQSVTGVQRFSIEITRALGRICAEHGESRPVILLPAAAARRAGAEWEPGAELEPRALGRLQGQLWEQIELPRYARTGLLVNLGNTAPVLAKSQVVVIHDAGIYTRPEAYSWSFRTWYRLLHSAISRGSAHVVTVSEFSRAEIIRWLGISPARTSVICEGADHILRFAPDPRVLERNTLRHGGYVLAVGSLAAHKNLFGLRCAAQDLAEAGLDLVIAGGLNDAVFATQKHVLPAPAKYIGRINDHELRALYEAAACCVFPSFYEGFGLPAVEAMICGCPLVVADIPALRELCGDAAVYCDPASPEDISEKLLSLLRNREVSDQLRTAMAVRVRAYTWQAAALGLKSVVDKLR